MKCILLSYASSYFPCFIMSRPVVNGLSLLHFILICILYCFVWIYLVSRAALWMTLTVSEWVKWILLDSLWGDFLFKQSFLYIDLAEERQNYSTWFMDTCCSYYYHELIFQVHVLKCFYFFLFKYLSEIAIFFLFIKELFILKKLHSPLNPHEKSLFPFKKL